MGGCQSVQRGRLVRSVKSYMMHLKMRKFLTVLLHGVVTIDGRQDVTQDCFMNGYLVGIYDEMTKKDEEMIEDDELTTMAIVARFPRQH